MEVIGSIAEGIAAMSWSPDGELVVLFTARDCNEPASIYLLVCHGSELEPLTDFTFCTDAFGEGSNTIMCVLSVYFLQCLHIQAAVPCLYSLLS